MLKSHNTKKENCTLSTSHEKKKVNIVQLKNHKLHQNKPPLWYTKSFQYYASLTQFYQEMKKKMHNQK